MAAYGGVGMDSQSGHFGGDDDPTTDYDEGSIRFGSMGYTTELSEAYVTTTQYMTRDLDDPYAYEKKPMHYIPGYTGHLPLNRERFGVNYREASAATLAMQRAKGVHHPVVPLDAPPPNYVRCRRHMAGHAAPSHACVPCGSVARADLTCPRSAARVRAVWPGQNQEVESQPEVCAGRPGSTGGGVKAAARPRRAARPGAVRRLPRGRRCWSGRGDQEGLHDHVQPRGTQQHPRRPSVARQPHRPPPRRAHQGEPAGGDRCPFTPVSPGLLRATATRLRPPLHR